jgi:predicted Zn-dependent peptidase
MQFSLFSREYNQFKNDRQQYFAAILANQILGGGGERKVVLNLREKHGWTYRLTLMGSVNTLKFLLNIGKKCSNGQFSC